MESKKKAGNGRLCFIVLTEFFIAICVERNSLEIHGGLEQESNENTNTFWKLLNCIFQNGLFISYLFSSLSEVSILQ